MTSENLETLEIVYWVFVIIVMLVTYGVWKFLTKRLAAQSYTRGRQAGRKWLTEGLMPASIESFLRVQHDGGVYGPFEAGVASVLKEEKK